MSGLRSPTGAGGDVFVQFDSLSERFPMDTEVTLDDIRSHFGATGGSLYQGDMLVVAKKDKVVPPGVYELRTPGTPRHNPTFPTPVGTRGGVGVGRGHHGAGRGTSTRKISVVAPTRKDSLVPMIGREPSIRVNANNGSPGQFNPNQHVRRSAVEGNIHMAVQQSDAVQLNILLAHGANPSQHDGWGLTPMHYAVHKNDLKMVTLLLDRGANPDAVNNYGQSPFHWACNQGLVPMVDLMLRRARVNIHLRDKEGIQPIDYVRKAHNPELLALFGGRVDDRSRCALPTCAGTCTEYVTIDAALQTKILQSLGVQVAPPLMVCAACAAAVRVAPVRITNLTRGGVRVATGAGPVQVGMPPETVKDSLMLCEPPELRIPEYFVVPKERFDRAVGAPVAEFEFPAYYNYFKLRRRITIITTASVREKLLQVFQETLLGPQTLDESELKFVAPERRPDLVKEMAYFAKNMQGEKLEITDLLNFIVFDADGVARIPYTHMLNDTCVTGEVLIVDAGPEFVIRENGVELCRTPAFIKLPLYHLDSEMSPYTTFDPPMFGVTILGNSHGFDCQHDTTGFVVWINKRGVMVDPPLHSSYVLRQSGIPARVIDAIIITHVHSDHDAGAFQKIITERRITFITTPTIWESFVRKYSAYSGFQPELLKSLVDFRPVTLNRPLRWHGAVFNFWYSLHSIPTIGFEIEYGGKSMCYSSDFMNDPPRLKQMVETGFMSPGRCEHLVTFPWHHDLIFHEAGVPPIHTPVSVLAALPPEIKEKLLLLHVDPTHVLPEMGLKIGPTGVENSLYLDVTPPLLHEPMETVDLISKCDFFSHLPFRVCEDVLQGVRRVTVHAGDSIVRVNEHEQKVFVIAHGVVGVLLNNDAFWLTCGDLFGENCIIANEPRQASVVAATDVELLELDYEIFTTLIGMPDVVLSDAGPRRTIRQRFENLHAIRREGSWATLQQNSAMSLWPACVKVYLQSALRVVSYEAGQKVWTAGQGANCMCLVASGSFRLSSTQPPRTDSPPAPPQFTSGAFVGEVAAILAYGLASTTFEALEPSRAFLIDRPDLKAWFHCFPGAYVQLDRQLFLL